MAVSRLVKGYNRMVTKRSKMPCRAELFGHPERARDLKLGLLRPPLASGNPNVLVMRWLAGLVRSSGPQHFGPSPLRARSRRSLNVLVMRRLAGLVKGYNRMVTKRSRMP